MTAMAMSERVHRMAQAIEGRTLCARCGEYEDQCLGHQRWEGDGPCQDCGQPNMRWFTDSPTWNLVMGGPEATDDPGGVVCPTCFAKRAVAAGIDPPAWRLTLDVDSAIPTTSASVCSACGTAWTAPNWRCDDHKVKEV